MSQKYIAQAWQTLVSQISPSLFFSFSLFLLFVVTVCVTMFCVVPVGRRQDELLDRLMVTLMASWI